MPDLAAFDGLPGDFDAVAISSYTAQIKDAYALADRYRRAGITVILGGLHVSAMPEEAAALLATVEAALHPGAAAASWP